MTQRPDKKCAILLDLAGSQITTNKFVEGLDQVVLKKGEFLTIVGDPDYLTSSKYNIGCSYTKLP